MDFNTIWFILVGVLLTGYAMLDGFDLGVGALHLFTRKDIDRRMMLNAIGPVWDGNEVWLVTGGGALFAAFPEVYATVFSGFYIPFMVLLAALIFRAVAIEFRSKVPHRWWRQMWDIAFSVGSILAALLIGVTIGNIVYGIDLSSQFEFQGTLLHQIHPYSIFVGITTVSLFMMHGAIYMVMKTEGEMREMAQRWVRNTVIFFLVCYVVFNVLTLFFVPHVAEIVKARPYTIGILILNILAVLNIVRQARRRNYFYAFMSSCAVIILLMTLFACSMYPNMVFSYPDLQNSLTIYNAASTQKTLGIMLIVAAIGVPIILAYTVSIYWIFRGKVEITDESY